MCIANDRRPSLISGDSSFFATKTCRRYPTIQHLYDYVTVSRDGTYHSHTIHYAEKHCSKQLAETYPKLAPMVLDEDNLTLALNEEYVTQVQPLKNGDTVALIPPISGG